MKILHYINQFFANIGGEEMADVPMTVREGVVGPGLAMQALLEEGNEIVATVICGDNYFVDHTDQVSRQLEEIIKDCGAELIIAGPAFFAGRYGMACGGVCKIAWDMGIPAVSGMYEENPGRELYQKFGFIFPTDNNARGMKKAAQAMTAFVNRYAQGGEEIYDYKKQGYFRRGIRKNIWREHVGAHRAVDMLLDKIAGRPFETELEMTSFSRVTPSAAVKDLSRAKIALISTCGAVPEGNPDKIESHAATRWAVYHVEDYQGPEMLHSIVAHGGCTPTFGYHNGNRMMPVDAMVELEKQGFIGTFNKDIYVTVGNSMPVARAAKFGEEIARSLKDSGVEGAILTSA